MHRRSSVAWMVAVAYVGCSAPAAPPPKPPVVAVAPVADAQQATPTPSTPELPYTPETPFKLEPLPPKPPPKPVKPKKPPKPETSVKDYTYVDAGKLTPLDPKTVAAYRALDKDRVVRIAVPVDGSAIPLLYANQGSEAGKAWTDAKGKPFEVEIVLADDPTAMRDELARGDVDAAWSSVDLLALMVDSGLGKDARTLPRVIEQTAWSNGGEGIVARNTIASVADLRGKTIAYAPNTRSEYVLRAVLQIAGLTDADVTLKATNTEFEAAAAFNNEPAIDAAATITPDLRALGVASNDAAVLIDTTAAMRLGAEVWFARADFAREHPEIVEGLARGVLDAVAALVDPDLKRPAGDLADAAFRLDHGTGVRMFDDVQWANYAENRAFFDKDDLTSFPRTYDRVLDAYKSRGLAKPLAADKLMDASVIKKLGADKKYAAQRRDEHAFSPTPTPVDATDLAIAESFGIEFFPNSFELHKKTSGKLADPDVDAKIAKIAALARVFSGVRIEIGGHTDASMRGNVDEELVVELSRKRAQAVKDELVAKYKLDPQQLVVTGYGWSQPADVKDPDNHAKNRRIEIRVARNL